ncbi:MAG: SPOR domain-containing protein [Neisseriaceae bacterium]|nr:SPOR domain-containing protein [Neisseriaceae bacterium]
MDTREEYEQLKRKNRNRLIGAIVVVAAVALILLAVTDKKAPQTAPEVTIAGKPQQPIEPLNLPTGKEEPQTEKPATEQEPIVIDSVAQPEPFEPVTDTPEPPATVAQKPAQPAAEKPVQKQAEKPVSRQPEKQPTKQAEKPAPKQPIKQAEKPAPKQPEKLSPQDILEGKTTASYVVQLGAFKTHAQADTQRAKLAQVGISSQIQQGKDKNGNAVYRVRTGSLNKADADKTVSLAKKHKFDAMIARQ